MFIIQCPESQHNFWSEQVHKLHCFGTITNLLIGLLSIVDFLELKMKVIIPDLFKCPISLDLFTDPVTLCTGQTYDRPFIEKWLADGNLTCPVTMQRLEDTSVVPNHTLRHLINQWLLSDLGLFSFSVLEKNLQSSDIRIQSKVESLRKIRDLSVESDAGRAYLIQVGFFPLLLQSLFYSPSVEDITELALECILSLLPYADLISLNVLNNQSSLDCLVLLLQQANANVQNGLCSLIESMTLSVTTREICLFFGHSHRFLQTLISVLYQNSDGAVRAISGICTLEANRENVVKAGAIDALITLLSKNSYRLSISLCVLTTLEVLLELDIGKKAARKNSSAIDALVKYIFRVSEDQEGSEYAIGSLLALCGSSPWARAEAVRCGVVMQLLLLLQSPCNATAKVKARALLKLFRFMWAEEG